MIPKWYLAPYLLTMKLTQISCLRATDDRSHVTLLSFATTFGHMTRIRVGNRCPILDIDFDQEDGRKHTNEGHVRS